MILSTVSFTTYYLELLLCELIFERLKRFQSIQRRYQNVQLESTKGTIVPIIDPLPRCG